MTGYSRSGTEQGFRKPKPPNRAGKLNIKENNFKEISF